MHTSGIGNGNRGSWNERTVRRELDALAAVRNRAYLRDLEPDLPRAVERRDLSRRLRHVHAAQSHQPELLCRSGGRSLLEHAVVVDSLVQRQTNRRSRRNERGLRGCSGEAASVAAQVGALHVLHRAVDCATARVSAGQSAYPDYAQLVFWRTYW